MRLIERKYRLLFAGLFLAMVVCMFVFCCLPVYLLKQSGMENAVIILDEEALKQGAETGMMLTDIKDITTTGEIRQDLIQDLQRMMFVCFGVFCLICGAVFAFAGGLNGRWRKKALETAFSEICDEEEVKYNNSIPERGRIYRTLKQHFEDRFDNYKRLSSYLSHEQKNSLALLRARLEYDGYCEYLTYVDSLNSHIDDILTLSDHSIGMDQQAVDCILLTAELCDEYRKLGVELNYEFDEERDCMIIAKERWIRRAVYNLIENAIKYGQGKPVAISVNRQYDSVIITVKDQGAGIPEDKLPFIFTNRYRIPLPNKDGYGIGLSLVSHVCDLCGGFAWAESKAEESTCFYLSLPAYKGL